MVTTSSLVSLPILNKFFKAYNTFTKYGRSSGWCKSHALSFRAMSRAVSIRSQLKKYMQRFGLPLDSCEGDSKRLARCLVSGYWRNGARWTANGTYRSVRGNIVGALLVHDWLLLLSIILGFISSSHIRAVHTET